MIKYPTWTVGLYADNESDPLSWKRFSNLATLFVYYDVPPNAPQIWDLTLAKWAGAAWAAGSTYVTRVPNPAYTVYSNGDPDGSRSGNLTMWFYVYAANSDGSKGALKFNGSSPPGLPDKGVLFQWQGGTLADGNYILEAFAVDGLGMGSPVMPGFHFTVDTVAPPTPLVIPGAGVTSTGSTTGSTSAVPGQDQLTFTLKDGGQHGVKSFMNDKIMDIMQEGTRREMLNLERFIVERDKGPLNLERWAGKFWEDVP